MSAISVARSAIRSGSAWICTNAVSTAARLRAGTGQPLGATCPSGPGARRDWVARIGRTGVGPGAGVLAGDAALEAARGIDGASAGASAESRIGTAGDESAQHGEIAGGGRLVGSAKGVVEIAGDRRLVPSAEGTVGVVGLGAVVGGGKGDVKVVGRGALVGGGDVKVTGLGALVGGGNGDVRVVGLGALVEGGDVKVAGRGALVEGDDGEVGVAGR